MALVLRQVKGTPLTIDELDGNFTYLDSNKQNLPQYSFITIDDDGETLSSDYSTYFINMRGYWTNYDYWYIYSNWVDFTIDDILVANYTVVTPNNDGDPSGGVYPDGTYLNGTFQGYVNGVTGSNWPNSDMFPSGPGMTFSGYIIQDDNGEGNYSGYLGGYGLPISPDNFVDGINMPDASIMVGESILFVRSDYDQNTSETSFLLNGNFFNGSTLTSYTLTTSGSSVKFISDGNYWIPISTIGY